MILDNDDPDRTLASDRLSNGPVGWPGDSTSLDCPADWPGAGNGAGVSLLTVAGAGRGARQRSRQLDQLSHGCPVDELAAIDEALDRILAEERRVLPGSRGG